MPHSSDRRLRGWRGGCQLTPCCWELDGWTCLLANTCMVSIIDIIKESFHSHNKCLVNTNHLFHSQNNFSAMSWFPQHQLKVASSSPNNPAPLIQLPTRLCDNGDNDSPSSVNFHGKLYKDTQTPWPFFYSFSALLTKVDALITRSYDQLSSTIDLKSLLPKMAFISLNVGCPPASSSAHL